MFILEVLFIGKKKPGVQDGSGPFEGSYMSRILGRKGKKAGNKRGDCE